MAEDIIGEYVLNITKENIKIAAHRGKIKLENVQLDGDLIGSHVLGAAGLSGFGILSCWARTMTIAVPLTNLEKEPTRFELQGLHLICVPLLPATAHKKYGAGTAVDPRCTLRTRAKRSALARYERNYYGGRVPGEGPPTRRIRIALKEAEKKLNGSIWRASGKTMKTSDSETNMDDAISDLGSSLFADSEVTPNAESVHDDLLLPQRTWKVKMREKIMRNLEVSMKNIHIRCEVSEQGLDFCKSLDTSKRKKCEKLPADQRAFAFGITVESIFVRTANDKWEIGSSKSVGSDSYSSRGSFQSIAGSSSGVSDVEYKVGQVNDLSVYWDDDPFLLLSESDILQSNNNNLSPLKLQGLISAAMEAMVQFQDPGFAIRTSLEKSEANSPSRKSFSTVKMECDVSRVHDYCLKGFSGMVNIRVSDRNMPGPMQLFAEFMPLEVDLTFYPHQFLQYQKLRSAMLSQQRFDTMLRQRPKVEICENPSDWWKYAIACVTTRPTSRPWGDILQIVHSRARYIELVEEKILNSSEGNGFHGGLNESDSLELLTLEDLLPIEALTAFHLLALRGAFKVHKESESFENRKSKRTDSRKSLSISRVPKTRLNPFRRVLGTSRNRSKSVDKGIRAQELLNSMPVEDNIIISSITRASLLQALQDRLGKKQWHNTFHLHHYSFIINLMQGDDRSFVRLELCTNGLVRSFGPDRRDFSFDISKFEIFDSQSHVPAFMPSHSTSSGNRILMFEGTSRNQSFDEINFKGNNDDNFVSLTLPPDGVACRVAAAQDLVSLTLGISAHPATLVWNKSCMESIADFFASPSVELKTEVTRQLRNVATPLARQALLAFLSPKAITLNMNVAAPKLWFPISLKRADGAVCLDAGKMRMRCSKEENKTDIKWNISARDIQVVFVRTSKVTSPYAYQGSSPVVDAEEIVIIRPFHVCVDAALTDKQYSKSSTWDELEPQVKTKFKKLKDSPTRWVDIKVSPICLNLVDAEVLARAIGKWYAFGLVKVKTRVASKSIQLKEKVKRNLLSFSEELETMDVVVDGEMLPSNSLSQYTIQVEKIELALEGHSKPWIRTKEQNTIADIDVRESYRRIGPLTRTYLLELLHIELRGSGQADTTKTVLMVSDASIIKIQNDASFNPSNYDRHLAEPQNTILIRADKDVPPLYTCVDGMLASAVPTTHSASTLQPQGNVVLETPLHIPGTSGDSFDKSNFPLNVNSGILCVVLYRDQGQHLDEVEIDFDSVVVRVTPTSLKDCAKATRRVLELIQIVTREMERKVHEQGRKARRREREGDNRTFEYPRPMSPAQTEFGSDIGSMSPKLDSSIIFKLTFRETTLLAGRPINSIQSYESPRRNNTVAHAVVQLVSNALVMFQSVENADGSGNKTLHASFDNLAASMNTQFIRLLVSEVPPMIGPVAAEFRIVYATENLGCVVSKDISLDCEAITARLTPTDIFILNCVLQRMAERLLSFSTENRDSENDSLISTSTRHSQPSFIRYKNKGTGIATGIRVELQHCSLVLLQAYRSKLGTRPLFDFAITDWKGKLEGCMSALSGDYNACVSLKHFNFELSNWEHVIEPFSLSLTVDQLPNELVSALTLILWYWTSYCFSRSSWLRQCV